MQIEKPETTIKQQKTGWINLLVHIHDLHCNCNKPLEHTIDIITEQEKHLRLEDCTKQSLQKCLSGDAAAGITHEDDTAVFDTGDLERLFATDFTDEEQG